MRTISIILRKPPYGTVDASEAIRHTLGAVTEELPVRLLLMDGGVHAARKGQDTGGTGYLSAEDGIRDCVGMGAQVYVDGRSLETEKVPVSDLLDGVMVADHAEIAQFLRDSGTVMIF